MKHGRQSAGKGSHSRVETALLEMTPKRPDLLAGEELSKEPTQRRSRQKREALLQRAVGLFERNGYEATAIDKIAKQAGISVGSFYQYFRSKRQLLLVLMNDLLERLEQIDLQLCGQGDLRTAIESVLRAALATDLAYAGAYRAWREAMLSDRQLASLDAAVRGWSTGRLQVVFGMLCQVRGARSSIDVSLFAAVMDRLFWELLASPLKSHARLIDTLFHIIYHSLFDDLAEKCSGPG